MSCISVEGFAVPLQSHDGFNFWSYSIPNFQITVFRRIAHTLWRALLLHLRHLLKLLKRLHFLPSSKRESSYHFPAYPYGLLKFLDTLLFLISTNRKSSCHLFACICLYSSLLLRSRQEKRTSSQPHAARVPSCPLVLEDGKKFDVIVCFQQGP